MAKSKRSKVKMAYKAMRRAVMQPQHDASLRETAAKVYKAIGLELPSERAEEGRMEPRMHGGSELVSTFVPTPKGPKLNVVHGPNALDDELMQLPREVVGGRIVGAGARARVRAELGDRSMDIEVEGEFEAVDAKPYFYPRREKRKGGIGKKRKGKKSRSLKEGRKGKSVVMETV